MRKKKRKKKAKVLKIQKRKGDPVPKERKGEDPLKKEGTEETNLLGRPKNLGGRKRVLKLSHLHEFPLVLLQLDDLDLQVSKK